MNTKNICLEANAILAKVANVLEKLDLNNHQKVLVGLSGGPDSIALIHSLKLLQKRFGHQIIAAHLDHEWRKNSANDIEFCRNICNALGIEFITKKASELNLDIKYNGSQEEVGRKMRRHFFVDTAQKIGAKYIALGHHLDDQIETFMMRLMRGSSPIGLGCMQIVNLPYIRPLLEVNKKDIINYLIKNKLKYLSDPTNNSDSYLRNRIRKLTPELENIDSRFKQNFARTLKQIQSTNYFLDQQAKAKLAVVASENKLDLKKFFKLEPFLQQQVLLAWLYQNQAIFSQSTKFINEILRFFKSPQGGAHQVHPGWRLVKKQNIVTLVYN